MGTPRSPMGSLGDSDGIPRNPVGIRWESHRNPIDSIRKPEEIRWDPCGFLRCPMIPTGFLRDPKESNGNPMGIR
eukprot:9282452-Pyramimonas_sp.AAC.1